MEPNDFTNYRHLAIEGGVMQLVHYPRSPDSRKGKCRKDAEKIFVHFTRYARFDMDNEEILAAAIDTLGPMSTSEI